MIGFFVISMMLGESIDLLVVYQQVMNAPCADEYGILAYGGTQMWRFLQTRPMFCLDTIIKNTELTFRNPWHLFSDNNHNNSDSWIMSKFPRWFFNHVKTAKTFPYHHKEPYDIYQSGKSICAVDSK